MIKRFLIVILISVLTGAAAGQVGIDANYALDMESHGATWSSNGKTQDLFSILKQAGCDKARIRLWTGDEGMNGLKYALETANRAKAAGLQNYLVIFLSENWADLVKQPAPTAWKSMTLDEKAKAVEEYSARVVGEFTKKGIDIEWFEIGNEIDFGICGIFEEEWPKRVSLEYMQSQIWPKMATIIRASQAGVLKVQPNAKFILHLAQWANADYCIAFWKYMLAQNIRLDFAGLSYFPTSAKPEERPLAFMKGQIDKIHAAIDRPVVICESGYPSAANFGGQFGDWNKPIDGYSLDEAGQAKWVGDYLAMTRESKNVAAAFYWSPEWCGPGMWEAFALFDAKGQARPALNSFALPPSTTKPTTRASTGALNVYFGNLHSHTGVSDGVGTPEQAYTYARDIGKLDFLAITEHNHLMGGDKATPAQRDNLYKGPEQNALIPVADRLNQPGKFVTIFGQEFSSMSKGNHVNVLDVNDVIDVPNGKYDELLKWLDKHRDSSGQIAILQMNHPGLGYPGKGIGKNEYGRDDFGDDAGWVRNMGAVTYLIEILNGEPPKGLIGKRSTQLMEDQFKIYLRQGFRVAPVADQDNHQANWGTATESRTGVIAAELSRPALLQALRSRHVYASEDRNLKLIFRVNGALCGDILSATQWPMKLSVEFEIEDPDEPDAVYSIEALSGSVGGPSVDVVKTISSVGKNAGKPGTIDGLNVDNSSQFFYFRIAQKSSAGTDRAWTAPVWFENAQK